MGIIHILSRFVLGAALCLCAMLAAAGGAEAGRLPAGTQVGSAATVVFNVDGAKGALKVQTNTPIIILRPIRSSSELSILRAVAADEPGIDARVGPVFYSPEPLNDKTRLFNPQDTTLLPEGTNDVRLSETSGFMPGETIFFHLNDRGINHLPDVAETVLVRFETTVGDVELFKLTASGPDSADFYGYAFISNVESLRHGDGQLSVVANDTIEASYTDEFEETDRRVSTAIVDPALRVFDAATGATIDGALIRVIDAATGDVVPVYGIDGISRLTDDIVTGQSVFDTGGRFYTAASGEARIPYLETGTYRLEIEPPSGYLFPSERDVQAIAGIDGVSFRLLPGAWGQDFEIVRGGPPGFDVPIDPRRTLFLRKSVSDADVAIGDTLFFTLSIRNDDAFASMDLVVTDILPAGFRLVPGSVTINGENAAVPTVNAAAGRQRFEVGTLQPGESREIRFAARVGVGARVGEHETTATASAATGFHSNTARVTVTVSDPLQRDRSYILGSVVVGACGTPGEGVRARLLTETGTTIETDRYGRFHIEGLSVGRHVLRLDETSLPEGLTLMACPGDLRPGDRLGSRLIDARGGLIRTVIFRLHDSRSKTKAAPVADNGSTAEGAEGTASRPEAEPESQGQSVARTAPVAAIPAKPKPPRTDYKPEDLTAFDGLTLVYPAEGATLMRPLFDLGIAYPFGNKVEVLVNGTPANEDRYEGIIGNKTARIAMRQWRGLETPEGAVRIEVIMRDKAGDESGRIMRQFGGTGGDAGPRPVADSTRENKAPVQKRAAASIAGNMTADDLAGLPAQVQVLYPDAAASVAGGSFDLGITVPFGTKVDVRMDGKVIDPTLSERSIVNRGARLSLRRWASVPLGEGVLTLTATTRTGEESTIERRFTRDESAPVPAPSAAAPVVAEADRTDLDSLARRLQFVYPAENASLSDPSLRLGIAHPIGTQLRVTVAGVELTDRSSEKGEVSRKARLLLKRWRGVDLADGATVIEASTLDKTGAVLETITRRVHYVTEAAEAVYLPGESTLVADGETESIIAVRLVDSGGRPLHEGRRVQATLAPPYRSALSVDRFEDNPLAASGATVTTLITEAGGIARLVLHPTTRSGEVDLRVLLGTGEARLRPWMAPAPRPWIVVGLAEGTAGYATVSGNMVAADRAGAEDGAFTDGKLAFYAKGAIKGEWLLTLAYDSEADFESDAVRDRIDPTAYYPVYGDASRRTDGAQSRYPLYVRLERGKFFAMFGDYDTGLNRTELGAYSRQLSGFKTVYEGERISLVAFAAEADRQFRRVELQANRGIGPYESGGEVARNSETVTLITRERERLDAVIAERVLAPDLDYDIDYDTGIVTLHLPPEAVDLDFNPRFVVIEFERDAADPGEITAGARVALRALDDRVELGATVVHEEGGGMDAKGDLVALDLTAQVTDDLEIVAEIAASQSEEDGTSKEGTAFRAETRYVRQNWSAKVYINESDKDFGVANRSTGNAGRRVIGAEMRASIDDTLFSGADGEKPETVELTAKVFRDQDLAGEAQRDSVEIGLSRAVDVGERGRGRVRIGYRGERDRTATGETGTTHRVVGEATASVLDGRAIVSLEREQTIYATGKATTPDATRATLRADLTDRIEGTLGVQVFDDGLDTTDLTAGLKARAWRGTVLEAGINAARGEAGAGDRINATFGVQQDFDLTDEISLTLRASRTQPLAGSDSPVANALFRNAAGVATTALSVGTAYDARGWKASVRVDGLRSEEGDRVDAKLAVLRDVSHGLKLAGALAARTTQTDEDTDSSIGLTLAGSYRSADRRTSGLQRLEATLDDDGTRSAIHSISISHDLTKRLSLAGVHALRFSDNGEKGFGSDSFTQFIASDLYYRVRENWQVGLHGDVLTTLKADQARLAFGASVGYSPRAGMLLSLGYNVDGFEDADFADTNHTRKGAYLRFSFSFDENDIDAVIPGFVRDFVQ